MAAAHRAQRAVQEFQTAPATEEALFLMTQSYDKLGLRQLRDDAQRVLQQSFPKGIYASGNVNADTAWWKLW